MTNKDYVQVASVVVREPDGRVRIAVAVEGLVVLVGEELR